MSSFDGGLPCGGLIQPCRLLRTNSKELGRPGSSRRGNDLGDVDEGWLLARQKKVGFEGCRYTKERLWFVELYAIVG